MSHSEPILVTGAAGQVGGIGGRIVESLRAEGVSVRALVHRDDERAEQLRGLGADVVVADLSEPAEVVAALDGCKRVYFGMGVSPAYLEATLVMAAAARQVAGFELLVNMSQMTISEMDFLHMTGSPQHRLHWLCEQALSWSGLPVVHLRPTVFQQNFLFWAWAAESIAKSGVVRLPFANGRSSPVAARDVAEVAATILRHPARFAGKVIELTGPRVAGMEELAEDYAAALGKPVRYESIPLEDWRENELRRRGLPEHVYAHILTMAKLHGAGRYDRLTDDIATILGRPAMSLRQTIEDEAERFKPWPVQPAASTTTQQG